MKKSLYTAILLLIVAASACKKEEAKDTSAYLCSFPCKECVNGLSRPIVCREGYNSNAEYEAALAAQEAGGATCTATTGTNADLVSADNKAAKEAAGYQCAKQ